jgi:hypothetical protein
LISDVHGGRDGEIGGRGRWPRTSHARRSWSGQRGDAEVRGQVIEAGREARPEDVRVAAKKSDEVRWQQAQG